MECACYTSARRHHQVIGRIGSTVLPFQITAPALATLTASAVVLVVTWGLWAWMLPSAFAVVIALGVPCGLAVLAQTTRIEGRDPFRAGAALARYAARPRRGLVGGRPEPRPHRRRWTASQLRARSLKEQR